MKPTHSDFELIKKINAADGSVMTTTLIDRVNCETLVKLGWLACLPSDGELQYGITPFGEAVATRK